MTNALENKVVIITGASSGIGEAVAHILAQQGCKLTLAARSRDKLEALAAGLDADCLVCRADMTVPDDIQNMVDATLERFGRIDVMFANAGVFIQGDFSDNDPDSVSEMLRLNVDGVLRCAHAVIPIMKAQGSGDILVTSSVAGHIRFKAGPVYGASKHAIETFVNTVRRQVAADGIRIGAIAPGRVANPIWGITDPTEIKRLSEEERTYVTSEDVARAALFMLSRPRHVTIRNLVMFPQMQDA